MFQTNIVILFFYIFLEFARINTRDRWPNFPLSPFYFIIFRSSIFKLAEEYELWSHTYILSILLFLEFHFQISGVLFYMHTFYIAVCKPYFWARSEKWFELCVDRLVSQSVNIFFLLCIHNMKQKIQTTFTDPTSFCDYTTSFVLVFSERFRSLPFHSRISRDCKNVGGFNKSVAI